MTPAKLEALNRADPAVRTAALELLDQISRPLAPREIERALRDAGHSKSWSCHIASCLRDLNLIAITPTEERP